MIDVNDILHQLKLDVRVILNQHLSLMMDIGTTEMNNLINSIETDITRKTYKETKELLSQHFIKLGLSLQKKQYRSPIEQAPSKPMRVNKNGKHLCNTRNEIFFSKMWRSWAMKIFPANYEIAKANGVHLETPIITITHCPYCGDKLE